MQLIVTVDERTRVQLREFVRSVNASTRAVAAIELQTVNAAAKRARTEMSRALAVNLGVKANTFTKPRNFAGKKTPIAITPASRATNTVSARITISPKRIPVTYFPWDLVGGVSTNEPIKPGRVRKSNKRPGWNAGVRWRIGSVASYDTHAFVGRGRRGTDDSSRSSNKFRVFRRVGVGRKIHELLGPSVAHAAAKDTAVAKALEVDVTQWMVDEMTRRIALLAKG